MGRVDMSDPMLGTNSVHCTTEEWNVVASQHLLDLTVTTFNSFILHREMSISKQQKPR